MANTLHPYAESDFETLRSLIVAPTLAPHFARLQDRGALESKLDDPRLERALCWTARADDLPAGFCMTFILEGRAAPWASILGGVLGSCRRRGVGSALLASALTGLVAERRVAEATLASWLPNPEAEGFVARHGFRHDRFFWEMERGLDPASEVAWPAGLEPRAFDSTDRAFEDWNQVRNRSFAERQRSVVTTVEDCRAFMKRSEPHGLMLVYRDVECVGFCRTGFQVRDGEIAILGVVPEARGVGLGRALLRWGVGWLLDHNVERVTLHVDGENETALALYRSEGFSVTRRRESWALPLR